MISAYHWAWFWTAAVTVAAAGLLVAARGGVAITSGLAVVPLLGALFVCPFGAFAHYAIPSDVLAGLPAGAGRYHLEAFEAYRSGAWGTIDFGRLQGVVTFPSIHTCLALLTAYAYRGNQLLAWPAALWNAVVLASTIPIGGHYYVDLIAGAALFLANALLLRARWSAKPLALQSASV